MHHIVLVHGWGQSSAFWKNIIPFLESNFHVIAVDLPGFGCSPAPRVPFWNVHDFADFLYCQLRAMGVLCPILVGHSFGGRVCAVYASKYPVAQLVLYSSSGIFQYSVLKLFCLVCSVVGLYFFPRFMHRLHSNFLKPSYYTNQSIHSLTQAHFVLRTYLHVHLYDSDLSHIFRVISVPTLLIYGAQDRIVDKSVGYSIHKLIPHSQLIVMSRSTHFASWEETEQFLLHLHSFFKSLHN